MPLPFFLILAMPLLAFIVAGVTERGNASWINARGVNIVIFAYSLISLLISIKLLINMGSYADTYGSSPILITGGVFWLIMDWMRMVFLFIVSVVSGLKLISGLKT